LSVTCAPPRSTERQRLAGTGADDLLHVGKLSTGRPLIARTKSPGWKPGCRRSAFGLDRIDPRDVLGPKDHQEAGESLRGEQEVRKVPPPRWPPSAHRLKNEAVPASSSLMRQSPPDQERSAACRRRNFTYPRAGSQTPSAGAMVVIDPNSSGPKPMEKTAP